MNNGKNSLAADNLMTEGSLWKSIILFSIPLMLSQVLQVLFNMADVATVGQFASAEALGAVGSTTTLVTLFTGFLIGIGSGINVRVAQYLGARRERDTEETVHTSFLVSLVAGVILGVLCYLFARPLLALLGTKDELIDGAVLYFKIYSFGMPGVALFNFGNGVISAAGDTKRPLIYLTAAGLLNVILNLFFVIVLGMAEDGVAWASIISQYLSASLIIIRLARSKSSCALSVRKLRFHRSKVEAILSLGVPAGIQNSIFSIANLFIQSGVNSFDAVYVEGNAAAANSDALVYNVMAALYTACSSFMGQNLGAGKRKRVMQSYIISLVYSFGIAAVLGALLLIFRDGFLSIFTNVPEVVEAGRERLIIMSTTYCISAFMDCTIAASRGIGKSLVPTIIVIMGSCVFRVAWVYTIFQHFHTLAGLYLLYPFSWAITAVAEIIYFVISYKKMSSAGAVFTGQEAQKIE